MFRTRGIDQAPQVEVDVDYGVRSLDSEMAEWYTNGANMTPSPSASILIEPADPPTEDEGANSQGSSTPQSPPSLAPEALVDDQIEVSAEDSPILRRLEVRLPSDLDADQSFVPQSPALDRGRSRYDTPPISRASSPSSSRSLPTSLISASSISSLSRTVSPADSSSDSPMREQLPPLSRSYVFSRTHWAVEEARIRMEEQGADLSLVLPTLQLPADSLLISDSSQLQESAGHGRQADRSDAKRPRPLRVILCGTNRTVNAYLRSLARDPRVKVYKLKGTGRSRDGIYDVGIVAAEDEEHHASSTTSDNGELHQHDYPMPSHDDPERSSLASSPAVSAKDKDVQFTSTKSADVSLLARIHVVGKGQDGNLQRVVKQVESQHHRLNALLNPFASSERNDQARADLEQLIRLWTRKGHVDEKSGSMLWYDVAVLTGDSRYLAGRDRDLVNRLTNMIPTTCYPEHLAQRLSVHVDTPFFKLRKEGYPRGHLSPTHLQRHLHEEPTPRCRPEGDQGASYFTPHSQEPAISMDAVEGLVDFLLTSSRVANHNRENASVQAFLRWKETQDDVALESSLESSGTAPIPTLARAGVNADWESNLSRRHAARAERKNPPAKTGGPLAMSLQHQSSAPANFFSHGAWRSKTMASQEPSQSLVSKLILGPLARIRAAVFPRETSTETSRWTWTAVACVTVALGWGCWWRMRAVG